MHIYVKIEYQPDGKLRMSVLEDMKENFLDLWIEGTDLRDMMERFRKSIRGRMQEADIQELKVFWYRQLTREERGRLNSVSDPKTAWYTMTHLTHWKPTEMVQMGGFCYELHEILRVDDDE